MYKEPPGAQKMTSRLHCFRWLSSVQASRQALDSYFGSGGGDGAGNGGLARARPLSASRLASYLQTYLNPRLPDWILDLQVRHVVMFDTSASFWSLLEASEPSGSSSRLHSMAQPLDVIALWDEGSPEIQDGGHCCASFSSCGSQCALRPINCWRCKSTHFKRDCKASQSAEDVQGLPPDQWPIHSSHPDQAPRPSTVPVLYDRPGAPPSHPEARSHVTPIQAFAETVIDRLLALEEGQAQITALLQQVLSQSSSPPAPVGFLGPVPVSTSPLPPPSQAPSLTSSGVTAAPPATMSATSIPPGRPPMVDAGAASPML